MVIHAVQEEGVYRNIHLGKGALRNTDEFVRIGDGSRTDQMLWPKMSGNGQNLCYKLWIRCF